MNDERLRRRLCEGDPATGENGLSPGEIHAMRRAVLTAAPEPRRRLLPALAGAAAAALLIAVFVLRPALRPDPVQPPAPPRIAAVPAQPPAPRALRPSPARTEPPVREEKKRPIQRRRYLRAASEETPALAALEPAGNPPEEPGIQQIQFSTPGGTRIIWTLTSGKASR